MGSFIDTLGAYIFGGLLFLTVARLNLYVVGSQQQSVFDLKAQQNCIQSAEIMEYDFYRLGNRIKDGVTPLAVAAADSITFYGDVDNDGVVDTVTYSTGTKTVTSNPHQKLLYRKVNRLSRTTMDVGITNFKLNYYDSSSVQTATLARISAIKISLDVESDARNISAGGRDTVYNTVHWQQFIVPKKLHR